MKTLKIYVVFLVLAIGLLAWVPQRAYSGARRDSSTRSAGTETRVVTDMWGREVRIPVKVEKIIALGPGAPRVAAYLDVMDMFIGAEEYDIQDFSVLRDYNPVHHDALRALPMVGMGGGSGDNNAFPEEIIMLAPDVILATFSREAADELQAQTGIPVVSIWLTTGLANETFYTGMRLFADVVGAQERCERVLSFVDASIADLNRRTSGIPDSGKLKAYTGAVTWNGRRGLAGTYSNFGPFQAINALNVAREASVDGFYEVDLERLIVWDPDVIFLDPGNMDLVNDEYATNPNYFRALRAIREGRVYTMPSFNFAGTNITYALMNAYFAGTILFPEQFADVNIVAKSAEILTMFLGKNTYDTMAAGGLYYGTITIGR